jgi:hypothetical protein
VHAPHVAGNLESVILCVLTLEEKGSKTELPLTPKFWTFLVSSHFQPMSSTLVVRSGGSLVKIFGDTYSQKGGKRRNSI